MKNSSVKRPNNDFCNKDDFFHYIFQVQMKAIFMTPSFKTSDYYEILRNVVPELDHSRPGELKSEG